MAVMPIFTTLLEILPACASDHRWATSHAKLGSFCNLGIGRKYSWLVLVVSTLWSQFAWGQITVGAERFEAYEDWLKGKRVGIIANHTSRVHDTHLVDFLIEKGVDIRIIWAPEHGFRGEAAAGEAQNDGRDAKSGLPVVSLYGKNKKPLAEHLDYVDLVVFDIQDVGARFYTYISTMSYAMEACAEYGKPFLVLDRPNPNGYYVDGPVLEKGFESFVGLHPVPVVHGLTVGEYAHMVNGEGWLKNGLKADLRVVKCEGYAHNMVVELPIAPSPNLPNLAAIALYPSLCFFEGTPISVGRGTDYPFQLIGAPWFLEGSFYFKPEPRRAAPNPPFLNEACTGILLSNFGEHYMPTLQKIYWLWLVEMYKSAPDKKGFFNPFFDKLAGTDKIRKAIISGMSADDLPKLYEKELASFKLKRLKYLLYP